MKDPFSNLTNYIIYIIYLFFLNYKWHVPLFAFGKKIILHEAKSEHLKTLLGFQGVIGLTVLSSPSPFHFFNLTELPTAFLFIPLVASQTDTITSINREKSQNLSPGIVCLSTLYNIVWLYYIQLFVFFYLEGLFVRVPTSCLQSEKSYHVICFSSL